MRKTQKSNLIETSEKLAVDTEELKNMLGCGRPTAVEIGSQAQARIEVGKRVLWNLRKIQKYLDSIATE